MRPHVTLVTADDMHLRDKDFAAVVRSGKPAYIHVDGILGRMRRKMVRVLCSLCERHYDARPNTFGGVEVVERLEPIDDIECYADIITGSLYRIDTGRCLSTSQLRLAQ